mmetsp:Transcript_12981/g.18042  ORF Transcript_12981/g.18042 Transcript_12981/m.18042 type:complete len:125 (-) Transcript_12981:107-481(-)
MQWIHSKQFSPLTNVAHLLLAMPSRSLTTQQVTITVRKAQRCDTAENSTQSDVSGESSHHASNNQLALSSQQFQLLNTSSVFKHRLDATSNLNCFQLGFPDVQKTCPPCQHGQLGKVQQPTNIE